MAEWSTAYVNDLPDSAFLYVEPGGEKDGDGKTTPRSLRHFPVRDAEGRLDEAHVANALSRIPQSNVPDSVKERLTNEAQRMLEEAKKMEPQTPAQTPAQDDATTVKALDATKAAVQMIDAALKAWLDAGGAEPPPTEVMAAMQQGASALQDALASYGGAGPDESMKAMTADEVLAYVTAETAKAQMEGGKRGLAKLKRLARIVELAKVYAWESTERMSVPIFTDPDQLKPEDASTPSPGAVSSPSAFMKNASDAAESLRKLKITTRPLADDEWPADMADPEFLKGSRDVKVPDWGFDPNADG
jgi:hypothetical protein